MHSGEKSRYRYSDSRPKEKAGVLGRQLQSRPPSAAVMHARSKIRSEVRGPSAQKPCQLGPAETRAPYGSADFEETWFSSKTLPSSAFSLLFFSLSSNFFAAFARLRRSFASSFNNLLSNSWSARDNAPMQIKIKNQKGAKNWDLQIITHEMCKLLLLKNYYRWELIKPRGTSSLI